MLNADHRRNFALARIKHHEDPAFCLAFVLCRILELVSIAFCLFQCYQLKVADFYQHGPCCSLAYSTWQLKQAILDDSSLLM